MIQRFYVHNFRCLENFELSLSDKQSSLLIGKNGSGKTTVSYALEVLQKIARGSNRVGELVKPSDLARGRLDVPVRFELEVRLQEQLYTYSLALELPEGYRELRVLEENLTVEGQPIFSRTGSQVELASVEKQKLARFLVDWFIVGLPVIQEQSSRDPLFIFKTWLSQMLILSPIPFLIQGESEGETLTPNRQVTNFGEWFSGLLAHSPAAYARIDTYLRAVMEDFKDIKNPSTRSDFRSLSIQFQQDKSSLSLPFGALADGEKCFFICAVVLAANDAYGPVFCFWDEPDNYLSPSEVGHFVMELRRSFQHGGQLMITSHNLEAIRQFSNENTLVLHRRSHLEPTTIRSLETVPGDLGDALLRGDVL